MHGSENTRKPPHILVFEVRAVAPTVNLHGKAVFALGNEFCDVKLGGRHRILAVTHQLAIDPNIKRRMYAAKMQYQIFGEHILVNVEKCNIRAYGISVFVCGPILWRFGSYARTVAHKRVIDVYVNRHSEILRLPIARHGDLVPIAYVVISVLKIFWSLVGIL